MVIFVFVYTVLEERSLGSAGRVTQNLSVGVLYTPNGLTKNEPLLCNYFSLRYLQRR